MAASARGAEEPPTGYVSRGRQWLVAAALGILVTTVVATIATAPYGTYHFQNLQPFGLIGNALALPLVSIVVMPCAVFGVVAYPFGLDRVAWQAMGIAVEKVLEVSAWVNGLSGSTVIVPAFGVAALGCLSVAILIVTLMVSPLRWLAAVPAALGLVLAATPQRFDLYVDRSGIGAALRGRDGRLVLRRRARPPSRPSSGSRPTATPGGRATLESAAGPRCDPLGCIVEGPGGRLVALVEDRRAFAEDCGRVAIVVSRLTAPPSCAAATVIDGAFLKTHGATAIRFTAAGETDRDGPHAGRDPPLARPPQRQHRRARRRARPRTRASRAPAPGRTRPTARRSVATNQTDQLALDLDPVGAEDARLVGGLAASSAIEEPRRRKRFSVASSSSISATTMSPVSAVVLRCG